MLDRKSYVYFIKKLREIEEAQIVISKGFSKLMYEDVDISFDSYRDLILNLLEVSMGDTERYTTTFIYETNWGESIDRDVLKEYGLDEIDSFEKLYDLIIAMKQDIKIFVIADTHFNHKNIIKYCNRPYKNVEFMNFDIITKWNKVVRPRDIVIHLGDFGFGTQMELNQIFNRLNGRKFLVMGNHDYRVGKQYYEEIGFEDVIKDEFVIGNIVLSHYPKKVNDNQINIYGHIHNKEPKDWYNDNKHYCVSVEKINYTPIDIDELLKGEKNEQ